MSDSPSSPGSSKHNSQAKAEETQDVRASHPRAAPHKVGAQAQGAAPRIALRPAALAITAILPALLLLFYDAASRREIFVARAGPPVAGYIGGALLSLAFWGLCLEAARNRSRAIRYVALFASGVTGALGVGGQLMFFASTHEYFNRETAIFSINLWPIIIHFLLINPWTSAIVLLGPALLAMAYGAFRHHIHGPRRAFGRTSSALALVVCLFSAFGPLAAAASKRGLPPEVLFWHAAGGLGLFAVGVVPRPKALPPGRHEAPPEPTAKVAPEAPSIVLIFGESVRQDSVCAEKREDCKDSPALDGAAPLRIGFKRSFAVASCTEVSAAILWSGLSIRSTSAMIQSAPLLWDYAKVRGYRTAYISSHNLAFADQSLFLVNSRIDLKREARDRMAHVDLDLGTPDEMAVDELVDYLSEGGPTFAVLHLSNTHLPYRQADGYTPHNISGDGDDDVARRRARYLNSIVHHDAMVGDFVQKLRKGPRGKNTIVVYTSDHGEAWGEHDAHTHTFDVYAEQVNVPLWVDAPEGTLTAVQLAELRKAASARPVFTADVGATLLDLMGALDETAFAKMTANLAGASVLRPPPPPRDMELSNCPPFRSCYPDAWGIVRWPLKYHYVGRAVRSVCTNLETDPGEKVELPLTECEELWQKASKQYGYKMDATATKQLPPIKPEGSGSKAGSENSSAEAASGAPSEPSTPSTLQGVP